MDDEYFPVASPGFNRGRLPAKPAELARFGLMTSDGEPWTPWLKAAGVKLPEPEGLVFSDANLLVQAAVDGRGIGLARRSIAEGEMAAGNLVRLFDVSVKAPDSYYLAWPRGAVPEKVRVFRAWMLEERKRRR